MTLQPTAVAPYLRCLTIKNVRTFAAASSGAQPKTAMTAKPGNPSCMTLPREEIKTTVIGNVVVSSIETNGPIAKLAVYFKAGSRFEKQPGTVHALRIFAGLGSSGASQFGISRNIDYNGGNLYCTAGREHVAYTLEATRNKIQSLDKFLQDASVNQVFKPWELHDHLPRLKLDRLIRPPEVRVLERLHKAAYRTGLGNSLYSPKYMVGKHSSDMLIEHVNSNFIEASVVALGMPHEQAVEFAKRLGIKQGGSRNLEGSKFSYGGEIRKESRGDLAYVTLAVEGAGLDKPKEVIAAAMVHRALGSGSRVKYGMNPGGKLDVVARNTPKDSVASGFSASYTDSGIVGVYLAASHCCIEQATRKAAEVLRTVAFTEEDASRARNILKADVSAALDTDSCLLDDMGLQSLFIKQVKSCEDVGRLIDSVKAADMTNVIKKSGGKFTMASYGNISKVPYLDQLK